MKPLTKIIIIWFISIVLLVSWWQWFWLVIIPTWQLVVGSIISIVIGRIIVVARWSIIRWMVVAKNWLIASIISIIHWWWRLLILPLIRLVLVVEILGWVLIAVLVWHVGISSLLAIVVSWLLVKILSSVTIIVVTTTAVFLYMALFTTTITNTIETWSGILLSISSCFRVSSSVKLDL